MNNIGARKNRDMEAGNVFKALLEKRDSETFPRLNQVWETPSFVGVSFKNGKQLSQGWA